MKDLQFFAGIDWGYEQHQACLIDSSGNKVAEHKFNHGDGLNQLAKWLMHHSDGACVSVAIETPHGPVVDTMMERDYTVYSINPKQLDRFRDRLSPSGAKDDRRDAMVLAISLLTDSHCFRQLQPHSAEIVELRELSRIAENLTKNRTQLTNQINQALWRYYPQFLKLGSKDLAKNWIAELWNKAPTPKAAKRLRKTSVEKLLKRNRIRRIGADEVIKILKQPSFPVAAGTEQAVCVTLTVAFQQLQLVQQQYAEISRQTESVIKRLEQSSEDESDHSWQRDVTILSSIPGVGSIVLATLLAESSDAWRRRDRKALRCLCGVAPVTKQSGKSRIVSRRLACNNRLRNAVYHWANVAIHHDQISDAKYKALRARGYSHPRAVRGVADRLLGVAVAMLNNQTEFKREQPVLQKAA